MRINQKMQYKLGKRLTMLAISGATLFGACSKDDDKKDDIVPKQDVEVVFSEGKTNSIRPDSIRLMLTRPDVDKIYLVPNGYIGAPTQIINNMRTRLLEPSIALDPTRVKGRGDFYFYPGNCSTADSLWFVQNGWTVNQKQR